MGPDEGETQSQMVPDKPVHVISVHPHADGKGFTVHHHHQPASHPDHQHVSHVSSHSAGNVSELGQHMREHGGKLHMSKNAKGMAMQGAKVDTG